MTLVQPMDDLNAQLLRTDLFIFDSDGVLVEEGRPIDGAQEIINHLKAKDRKIVVFSNNSTKHPHTMKLNYLDNGLMIDEIVNSSIITAEYCVHNNIKKAYVIGEAGLIEVLQEYGIIYSTQDVDAVIIGMDRDLTYDKLAIATRMIRSGVRFVATNPDKSFPTSRGLEPGAGSMIAALVASTDTEPDIILGKPEVHGFEYILEKYQIKSDACLMIGDRYETDILGAIRANIPAVIVNTGVARSRADPGCYGDYPEIRVIQNLRELKIT